MLASSSLCWERAISLNLFSFRVFNGSCLALLFDLPLVASGVLGREAACGANAAIGFKPLDFLDSLSVHLVCMYDVMVIYVVFFLETGHAEQV